jgi:hypothetical protein
MEEHWKNLSLVDIEGEEWKDVIGYEGLYKISNMGRGKSLKRLIYNNRGGQYWIRDKILKPVKVNGYVRFHFFNGTKKGKLCLIHRLVAIAFIPNPDNLPEVNHKKGIRCDNRANELEWVTQSENHKHAYRIGLQISQKGEENGLSKLTRKQVDEIRAKYIPVKYSQYKLAIEYGVCQQNISDIINYKLWK